MSNAAFSFKPLFKILIDRGMKKKDLAKLAGVSAATITKMSKEGNYVNSDVIVKICIALHCKPGDILTIKPANDQATSENENALPNPQRDSEAAPELNLKTEMTVNTDITGEYELLPRDQEIVHFIYERIHYHKDNPPMYLLKMIMSEYGSKKPNMLMGEAKMLIPQDRYYSLVLNEVFEKFGKDGYAFDKKHIPFSLIESGHFEPKGSDMEIQV